jgi:hypothetical protein
MFPRNSTVLRWAVTLDVLPIVDPPSLMESPTPDVAETEQPGSTDTRNKERSDRGAVIALAAIIVVYFAAIGYLAATGRFAFVWKTTIVPMLLLVALVTRRFAPFVKDWSVFLGAVVLFDCLRGLVFSLVLRFRLPYYAAYVIDWDRALLGGKTLPTILQESLFNGVIGWFEKILVVIHGSHFVFFLFAGIAVWLFRRAEFWRFKRAFVLLMVCGITAYFLVPTVPPWMATSAPKSTTSPFQRFSAPSTPIRLEPCLPYTPPSLAFAHSSPSTTSAAGPFHLPSTPSRSCSSSPISESTTSSIFSLVCSWPESSTCSATVFRRCRGA